MRGAVAHIRPRSNHITKPTLPLRAAIYASFQGVKLEGHTSKERKGSRILLLQLMRNLGCEI